MLLQAAQEGLDRAGSGLTLSREMRLYVRSGCRVRRLHVGPIAAGAFIGLLIFTWLGSPTNVVAISLGLPPLDHMNAPLGEPGFASEFFFLLASTIVRGTPAIWVGFVATTAFSRASWGSGYGAYRTLKPLLRAMAACGEADLEDSDLPPRLEAVKKAVRRAHARRHTVPVFSHRRRALRRHAALVVAALLAAEGRLDLDPPVARTELARLLHLIAQRFTEARIGALLDESDLSGVQPARNWEPLRLALLTAGLPLVSWLPAALGAPESARVPAAVAGIVLVAVALYGRTWPDALSRARAALAGAGSSS